MLCMNQYTFVSTIIWILIVTTVHRMFFFLVLRDPLQPLLILLQHIIFINENALQLFSQKNIFKENSLPCKEELFIKIVTEYWYPYSHVRLNHLCDFVFRLCIASNSICKWNLSFGNGPLRNWRHMFEITILGKQFGNLHKIMIYLPYWLGQNFPQKIFNIVIRYAWFFVSGKSLFDSEGHKKLFMQSFFPHLSSEWVPNITYRVTSAWVKMTTVNG